MDKIIDWEIFRKPIEEALYIESKAPGGRPPFDRLMMFKILILQKYYNLFRYEQLIRLQKVKII
ncbi:transposase [Sulfurovum sp. NBC37-1]|uniref:transposase n=1 Tax=Sulfurovum sp. (strain NBC37-1) TaxID=387093 RepID=UPI0002FFF4F5|nr:transposase [Sulfurovum sp. NBC37-1]